MIVYVETNFLLEVALRQEQSVSCERLLKLAESSALELAFPAFSVLEPYQTLRRRERSRRVLQERLDQELVQLRRTSEYQDRLTGADLLRTLLIESHREQSQALEAVRKRLVRAARILPLDSHVLREATALQRQGMSAEDACVLASVLIDLAARRPAKACFLNRNAKDFGDPDLVEGLKRLNCKTILSFDKGLRYVESTLP